MGTSSNWTVSLRANTPNFFGTYFYSTLKSQKSNKLITKSIIRGKKLNDIGLRICNFEAEMVKNAALKKLDFWVSASHY